jgi:hypothetical protein
MIDHLTRQHGSALAASDVAGIEHVFSSFSSSWPHALVCDERRQARRDAVSELPGPANWPMTGRATSAEYGQRGDFQDPQGHRARQPHCADRERFRRPKALRWSASTGGHGATVTAFYTSNVEQCLFQNAVWGDFARNVATLPQDEASTFIRSCFNTCARRLDRSVSLLDSIRS